MKALDYTYYYDRLTTAASVCCNCCSC